jgi:hypothetical protein
VLQVKLDYLVLQVLQVLKGQLVLQEHRALLAKVQQVLLARLAQGVLLEI